MTKIMAIVNVSPDSFAGDGTADEERLTERLEIIMRNHADIIDVGGQSTRPGAEIVGEEEELRRVIPAIRKVREITSVPISVDTFKPLVAAAAIKAGATMVNDIHGCADPEMANIVKRAGADVVVMHSRGTPQTMGVLTSYPRGLMPELLDFFDRRTTSLIESGIPREAIIIDPGIGFAKTATQSFEATASLSDLKLLGFRVLYGASMKSFLGHALASRAGDPAAVAERGVATTVVITYAMMHGVDIVRVHDVRAAWQARRVLECVTQQVSSHKGT